MIDTDAPGTERYDTFRRLVERLQADQSTPYDKSNPEHEQLLLKLWAVAFPGVALHARVSDQWKALGFQSNDPATDFRGMGLLGLKNLIYFGEVHGERFRMLIAAQERRREKMYPFAVVGINITYLLFFELLMGNQVKRSDGRKGSTIPLATVENLLRDNENAFEEIYCQVLEIFDLIWDEMNAAYMDFPKVIHSIRDMLEDVFSQPLKQLADFSRSALNWRRERTLLASTVTQELVTFVPHEDVDRMLSVQKNILETLHGMNIALEGFNASSANLYASLSKDFDRYTRQMKQLKEDLDQIFRRIRTLKAKIEQRYPETAQAVMSSSSPSHGNVV